MAKKIPKQRLFIFDRKEIVVLVFLGTMVAIFTFTLGVHLEKYVGGKNQDIVKESVPLVRTVADHISPHQQLDRQNKATQQALDDTLSQELHDEVTRTGIKIDAPKPVDLPTTPKNPTAGATTLTINHKTLSQKPLRKPSEAESKPETSRYTLQIGSYPSMEEAKKQLSTFAQSELKPFLREADVKGKGKWYRLYLGEFDTRTHAEQMGKKYQAEHKISSFIVAKLVE